MLYLWGLWGTGRACPEKQWMPHPWKYSRLGRMGLLEPWSMKGVSIYGRVIGTKWSLRTLPTQTILYDSMWTPWIQLEFGVKHQHLTDTCFWLALASAFSALCQITSIFLTLYTQYRVTSHYSRLQKQIKLIHILQTLDSLSKEEII